MDAVQYREAAEVNLSQARAELSARGFDYLSASRQTMMLNDALQEFEDFWNWPWLHKSASGAAPLQISDLRAVLKVYDQTGNPVQGITDSDNVDVTQTGTPQNWWIDDSSGTPTFIGFPVGTATFSVRYIKNTTDLSADGDTPDIPAQYHRIWIDLAVARAYEDSDNFAASAQIRQLANQRLASIQARYENRDLQSSPQRGYSLSSLDD